MLGQVTSGSVILHLVMSG